VSSPVRLLLVSGVPGVDTPAFAAATCSALAAAGRVPVPISADSPATGSTYQSIWNGLAQGAGALLTGLGLGGIDADAIGLVPGLADLAICLAACEATPEDGGAVVDGGADGDVDGGADGDRRLVVWDAGSGEAALRALSALTTARALLEAVVTPATTTRVRPQGGEVLSAIGALMARVQAAEERLATSAVGWVLHRDPGIDQGVDSGTAGLGWTESGCRIASGIGLWQVPVRLVDAIDPRDPRVAIASMVRRDLVGGSRPTMQWLEGSAIEGYRLCLRLPHAHRNRLRVGRLRSQLILGQDQLRRRIDLPATLQRCILQGASLSNGVLVTRFSPDIQAWPAGETHV